MAAAAAHFAALPALPGLPPDVPLSPPDAASGINIADWLLDVVIK